MKLRIHIAITLVLVLCFGVLGVSKKSSYTDVTSNPNYIYDFCVGEMPTDYAINDCQFLKEALPAAPVILKVTPLAPPECFFDGRQQKVRVVDIFAGEGLKRGDEIYITSNRWDVRPEAKTLDTGFTNIMKEGSEYLVFLEESTRYAEYTDEQNVKLFFLLTDLEHFIICPVFNCDSCENVILPVSGDSTYVPYSEVAENEFFAVEQEGLDAFLDLKQTMLDLYVNH